MEFPGTYQNILTLSDLYHAEEFLCSHDSLVDKYTGLCICLQSPAKQNNIYST